MLLLFYGYSKLVGEEPLANVNTFNISNLSIREYGHILTINQLFHFFVLELLKYNLVDILKLLLNSLTLSHLY
jgi:hypothetical protein